MENVISEDIINLVKFLHNKYNSKYSLEFLLNRYSPKISIEKKIYKTEKKNNKI